MCIVGFALYEKNVHQPWPLALKSVRINATGRARYQDLTGRAQITPRGVGVEGKQKGTHASIATADTHATAGT